MSTSEIKQPSRGVEATQVTKELSPRHKAIFAALETQRKLKEWIAARDAGRNPGALVYSLHAAAKPTGTQPPTY